MGSFYFTTLGPYSNFVISTSTPMKTSQKHDCIKSCDHFFHGNQILLAVVNYHPIQSYTEHDFHVATQTKYGHFQFRNNTKRQDSNDQNAKCKV